MPTAKRCLPFLFSLCVYAVGCSQPPTLEPTYEACASDENWINFDDYEKTGRVTSDGAMLPQWLMPAMGAAIAGGMPPVFQWQPSTQNAGSLDGDVTCPQYQPAALKSGGLQLEHLPAVSGTVYDLHLAIDGSDVYRVVTTRQRAGITMATWSGWSGKTITATLYAAKMLVNAIVEGPYQASPLTVIAQ